MVCGSKGFTEGARKSADGGAIVDILTLLAAAESGALALVAQLVLLGSPGAVVGLLMAPAKSGLKGLDMVSISLYSNCLIIVVVTTLGYEIFLAMTESSSLFRASSLHVLR